MSFEGMDVEQAQSLAQRLDANAQALAHITAGLTALTAELSRSWLGPASATFQQEWMTQHRSALAGAAQALSDMHTRLKANIQQQINASAANGGSGSGGVLTAVLGGVRRGWDDLQTAAGWEGLVQTPLDKITEIAGNDDVAGRYDKTWTRLMSIDHDSPLLKYKQSPILHALHDNPHVQQAGEILGNTHSTAVLDKLGTAGKGLGYATTTVDGLEAANDVREGHYASATGNAVDATSSALMNSDNPAGFLAGFDIALLKKDYELEQQIDWKQGIPNPLNASNFENDYVPTFKALPGQLVSTLAGII